MTKLLNFSAYFIGTAAGAGLSPKMPGTVGTLAGAFLFWLAWSLTPEWRMFLLGAAILLGIWSAYRIESLSKIKDNQKIVIDEVVGYWVAAWTVTHWHGLLVAFILFRLFDIKKFFPVRSVDRWSKNQKNRLLRASFVIVDDLLAGIQTLVIILVLQYWAPFPL